MLILQCSIKQKFPSPYGDFVFQHIDDVDDKIKISWCFRPLTGILFFNAREVRHDKKSQIRFRPLTGILFFNSRGAHLRSSASMVSVPLRGFCFSTVPPKSLVIPDLSKPIAERRLKFLFQSAACGLEWASALVRQGAERMRGFLSDGATIFLYSPLRRGFLLCWRFSASSS